MFIYFVNQCQYHFPKTERTIYSGPISMKVRRGQTPLKWPISWLDWTDQCCRYCRLSSHQTLDRSVTSSQGLAVRTEIWEGIGQIHVGKNTGFLGLWTMRSLINHWAGGRFGWEKRDQQLVSNPRELASNGKWWTQLDACWKVTRRGS